MAFKRVIIRRVGPLSWLLELMKNIFVFSVVLFLTLLPSVSKSCLPGIFSDEERISDAKSIFIGQVTGKRLDAVERNLNNKSDIVLIPSPGIYNTLRVFVTKSLKGRSKKVISAQICSCGCGGASLGDTVVVFRSRDGSFYVSKDEEMITSVSNILGKKL